jgi:hypothetical protein
MPEYDTNPEDQAYNENRGVSRGHHGQRLQDQQIQRLQAMDDPGSGAPEYNAWAAANGADMSTGIPDWGPNSENHPEYAAAMYEKQLNDRSDGMGQYGGHY